MAKKFFIEITDPEKNKTHISEFNQSKTFNSIGACQKFFDDNFFVNTENFIVNLGVLNGSREKEKQVKMVDYRLFTENKNGINIVEIKFDKKSSWLVKSVLVWKKKKTRAVIVKTLNKNLAKNITIPSIINGKPVVSIGNWAFNGCAELTKIVVPDSVTYIGAWAFGACVRLENMVVPSSVTFIGNYAFGGCVKLTKISVPDSVKFFGNNVFVGCKSLNSAITRV